MLLKNVVGEEAKDSGDNVFRGQFEFAFRIEELMHVSWDLPGTNRFIWEEEQLMTMETLAAIQKNETHERVLTLPGFEALLLETLGNERRGCGKQSQSDPKT